MYLSHPKIKVLQYMYGELEYFSWSQKINRASCERHDYEYVIRRDTPRSDRHTTWHKVPVMLDELHDCDFLLFMDADAVFYSQELKIEEQLIPLMNGKPLLMAQDVGSEREHWMPNHPNSGVILMKNEQKVREFLSLWNQGSERDESTRWQWPVEQLALWNVVMPVYSDYLEVCLEYYLIHGRYGQYIRHFMITSNQERAALMQAICQSRKIG